MQLNIIFLLLGVTFSVCVLSSRALALDPNKAITQYVHNSWQEGLPQYNITAITQTRDGYIWLGTYEGLVRFDGVSFSVYDQRNTKELLGRGITALLGDRDGALWIGTSNGGLTHYQNGKFTTYAARDGLPANYIRVIYQDRQGGFWLGTDGSGLVHYQNGLFTSYTTKNGLPHDNIRSIVEDNLGNMWIGTFNGLCRLRDGRFTVYTTKDGLSSDRIYALYSDQKGVLWIGTWGGGLCRWEEGRVSVYSKKDGLTDDLIEVMRSDSDGNLWIGSKNNGLNRFSNGKFDAFTVKEGLLNNSVKSIFVDREGSVWVGTNNGLSRFRDGRFLTYTTKEGLSDDYARSIYSDRSSNIWVGTINGLNLLQNGKFTVYTVADGLSNNYARAICEDREHNIWIGTMDGLNRFSKGKIKVYTTKDGLPSNFISAIYEDHNGRLWIGSESGGLSYYEGGAFTNYTKANGLPSNSVLSIYQDLRGVLWVGTINGLCSLSNNKIDTYADLEGLAKDGIFSFHEDRQGSLWIGTEGGLYRYRAGRFTRFTKQAGLFNDIAFQILEDNQQNLWMSCNQGVYRIRIKDVDDYESGAIKAIPYVAYDKSDGMASTQCNGATQPAGCRTDDGRLWFPTTTGIVAIDPDQISENRSPVPIAIDKIVIDDQSLQLMDGIKLSPDKLKFEFHYAGLSFLAPERVKFRYKLAGLDKNWLEAGTRRVAYYNDIPPGDYEFKVIACNNDGIWNETGASFRFHILTPLWRTWWAYLLYTGTFVGAGYGGIHFRLKTLQWRAAVLEGKVVERTKELAERNQELAQSEKKVKKQAEELVEKVKELGKKNEELIVSQLRADRIFSALAEALPGTVLDEKYRIDEKIGSGGYGAVYRATHMSMKCPVAVKVFKPSPGNDSAEALERFQQEAVSACRIHHPNAVAVLDSGTSSDGIAYLVMELLNGRTLAREMSIKGKLSVQRTARILIPVCDVLSKAHSMGIVHRDIKPDNIFLHYGQEGEVVKVVDFGIAKLMESTGSVEIKNLTATGGILGTPTYIAPERIQNQPYDGRSDVYSLGVVLYEMLCGQLPFESISGNVWSIIHMHLKETPRPPREVNPTIPEAVEALILRTLEKDPKKRPIAMELRHELLKLQV
jgi:ligand-binding sensor domain-containing protein